MILITISRSSAADGCAVATFDRGFGTKMPPDIKERMVIRIYRDIINHDVARRYEVREIEKLESVATTFLASAPGPVTLNGTRRALGGRVSLDSIDR